MLFLSKEKKDQKKSVWGKVVAEMTPAEYMSEKVRKRLVYQKKSQEEKNLINVITCARRKGDHVQLADFRKQLIALRLKIKQGKQLI